MSVMPAPGWCSTRFWIPAPPPPSRPTGAALQAAPDQAQNRAVRRGQRHHSRTAPVSEAGERWVRSAARAPRLRPVGFVGPWQRERAIPEARPAFDAAIGTQTPEDSGQQPDHPRDVRRTVYFSTAAARTDVTRCHASLLEKRKVYGRYCNGCSGNFTLAPAVRALPTPPNGTDLR